MSTPRDHDIIHTDLLPEGTALIMPRSALGTMRVFPLRIEEPPFRPAPDGWSQPARDEWDRAMQYLAVSLDRMADEVPGSSPARWRAEHADERRRRDDKVRFRLDMDARLELAVHRPTVFRNIGGS